MNANEINSLAKATQDGKMPFPEIVEKLIANGVEYYHVDFVTYSFTFYNALGATVSTPLCYEDLPILSNTFNSGELKSAIIDSQQHGQKFRVFCERAIKAGTHGYFAFLSGKRVVYYGCSGEQHIELFPGSKPTDA